ncbi:MAG: hypothetical protein WCW17_03645 [Patescibacteria group bacterium]|jgi:DNA polymerase-4
MELKHIPKDYQILFLDMNAYFASVEQQVRPELRGRPIGVAPYTGDSGCIISPSYEAKALGVKTVMGVGEAKKICPKINIIEARPALYSFYHKEIVKKVESFSPFVKVASIDEMFMKLSPLEQNAEISQKLALEIKAGISEIGDWLKCSIGIGPNRFLAKQAAELRKPDGFYQITINKLKEYYKMISLRDLCGINYRIEERCNRIGIYSPSDFFARDFNSLNKAWGHYGKNWYFRLRGYEVDDFTSQTSTVGHSCVLPPEMRQMHKAKLVLIKLIEKTGYRLRQNNLKAGSLYLGIYFLNGTRWSCKLKFSPFSDSQAFLKNGLFLFNKCPFKSSPIQLVISTFNLSKSGHDQVSLFDQSERDKNASSAIDQINDKYGSGTVRSSYLIETDDYAPDRIPFGKPRYDILN